MYGMNETSLGDVPQAFATALRVEIARANMSNNAVARAAGVSTGVMSKYVNGLQTPRLEEYYALADALGIDAKYFYDAVQAELRRMQG